MSSIIRGLEVLIAVVFILGLLFNFNSQIPRIPGDIIIDKLGFRIYIPFASAIVVSIIAIMLWNLLPK